MIVGRNGLGGCLGPPSAKGISLLALLTGSQLYFPAACQCSETGRLVPSLRFYPLHDIQPIRMIPFACGGQGGVLQLIQSGASVLK